MKSRIRELCRERGISTYRLAKNTGMTVEAFRRYEIKGLDNSYFGCMVRIAKALNCELEDLYEEERKE